MSRNIRAFLALGKPYDCCRDDTAEHKLNIKDHGYIENQNFQRCHCFKRPYVSCKRHGQPCGSSTQGLTEMNNHLPL